jgi:hypothetical protein
MHGTRVVAIETNVMQVMFMMCQLIDELEPRVLFSFIDPNAGLTMARPMVCM